MAKITNMNNYINEILKLHNYVDGIIVTDNKGFIVYFKTNRPDINPYSEKDYLNRHILDMYPNLDSETSTIMKVIKTRQPIFNSSQVIKTKDGLTRHLIDTTIPIMEKEKFVGVVCISRYNNPGKKEQTININDKFFKDKKANSLFTLDDIITANPKMLDIKRLIAKISTSKSPVLIYGETGTGKELVAQSIHSSSDRSSGPFIWQNCAAIPSNLLEMILFGTTKGAYTGSLEKKGLLELANNGTIFLDEINSLNSDLQAKILRAIEEGTFRKLGGEKLVQSNFRVISASNEKPDVILTSKRFRQDLFFRISTVYIELPPLNKRREDIQLLTDYFIQYYNKTMNNQILRVDDNVYSLLQNYHWPGNIRELKNLIERLFNFSTDNIITEMDLPEHIKESSDISFKNGIVQNKKETLSELMNKYERKILIDEISSCNTLTEAAKNLGISKQSMNYRLKKHNIILTKKIDVED